MKLFKYSLILIFVIILLPNIVKAATLYLDPSEGIYGPGNSFAVDLRIDVDVKEGCVNTVEAYIGFTENYLYVHDFIIGESLLNFWVVRPGKQGIREANDKGFLHFAGGIPGGYCGKIPGDPGKSNVVGRIIFGIPSLIISDEETDMLEVKILDDSRVLLNDGLGTEDSLIIKDAKFKYSDRPVIPTEKWKEQIKNDIIPPEPFILELHKNKNVYDDQYYIIFSTIDKQSGLDYFEILEIEPEEELGVQPEKSFLDYILRRERDVPNWKQAKMPYLLEDQSLESIIKVRAVDKAGNERIVEYIPPKSMKVKAQEPFNQNITMVLLIIAGVLVLIVFIILIIKKIRRSASRKITADKNNNEEE